MGIYYRLMVGRTQLADGSVYSSKLGLSIQSGTGSPAAAGNYVSYTTAYATPPFLDVVLAGTPLQQGLHMTGHGSIAYFDVLRVRAGSFQWRGSPIFRGRWRALGFLDTQSG